MPRPLALMSQSGAPHYLYISWLPLCFLCCRNLRSPRSLTVSLARFLHHFKSRLFKGNTASLGYLDRYGPHLQLCLAGIIASHPVSRRHDLALLALVCPGLPCFAVFCPALPCFALFRPILPSSPFSSSLSSFSCGDCSFLALAIAGFYQSC